MKKIIDFEVDKPRAAALIVVAGLAVVAFKMSYTHIFDLALRHGQDRTDAHLEPLSIDGLIIAAGIMLLRARKQWRAWLSLGLGIAATVAANAASGLVINGRWIDGIISAWPAISLVVCVEMVFADLREDRAQEKPALELAEFVPADAFQAALQGLKATHAAGNPLSQNQLIERYNLSRTDARKVVAMAMGETNGHSA